MTLDKSCMPATAFDEMQVHMGEWIVKGLNDDCKRMDVVDFKKGKIRRVRFV